MKVIISDPDLDEYEVEVPDDDTAAIAEIEAFTRENTRLFQNAERKERYHTRFRLDHMKYESSSIAYRMTPETILLRKERKQEIQLALALLTSTQHRRLEMLMEGLSYREIAEIEAVDFSCIAESIKSARKKLKKLL